MHMHDNMDLCIIMSAMKQKLKNFEWEIEEII